MRPRALRHALAFALCGTAMASAWAADARRDVSPANPGDATPVAPAIATAREVAADPAGVWARFFAQADLDTAYDQYGVLDDLGLGEQSADAGQCRASASKLKAAVEAIPVSIAIHRAAMFCADAVGDKPGAEREAAALAALAKHALADGAGSRWRPPIRVLSPRDVYALLDLLGYEVQYAHYTDAVVGRCFPLEIAAWDADAKQERHLAFDFVEAAARIDRGEKYFGLPFRRTILASSFVSGQIESGEVAAIDIRAIRDAREAGTQAERLKLLRDAASRGGLQSATQWMLLCAKDAPPGCADGLVDALLPLAERRQARAMVLLAGAYADGIGIEPDAQAATVLLDAADRRWQGQDATIMFGGLQMLLKGALDPLAAERLRRLSAAGSDAAGFVLVADGLGRDPGRDLSPAEIALLRRPRFNGAGEGQILLFNYFLRRSMVAERDAALRAAADLGYAEAQRKLAFETLAQEGRQASGPRGMPLMERAAQGGDAPAARMMAAVARDRKQWLEAAGWLLGAVDHGDVPALYELAQLYEAGHDGLPGKLDDAIASYEEIAADRTDTDTAPRARRRLATLALEGRGMKRNPKRAREWLLVDAQRDDAPSQVQLAVAYLDGSFGEADAAEGERWLKRASDNGSVEARTVYGTWLVSRRGSAETHQRGVELLRAAAKDGGLTQLNNLGWFQCVSSFPEVRDPAAGLAAARRMQLRDGTLDARYLDTIAACYAANGDFETAVRLQQQVVAADAGGESGAVSQGGPGGRLALYRAGKPYVEAAQ